jgi:hypothetical protein
MRSTLRVAFAGALLASMMAALPGTAEAVSVRGVRSCGVWARDRDATDKSWLTGFMSGIAFSTNVDALRGTEPDSWYLWMDKYCRENPLKDIADGAEELFRELRRARGL